MEETGYKIKEGRLKHIATFFSSPGGTSERVFLYYAEVGDADKVEKGGGKDGEDIKVHLLPLDDLVEQLKCRQIEDPKLLIGALWMQDALKDQARTPLGPGGVK